MKMALCDDDRKLFRDLKLEMYIYANSCKFDLVIDTYHCGEDLLKNGKAVHASENFSRALRRHTESILI